MELEEENHNETDGSEGDIMFWSAGFQLTRNRSSLHLLNLHLNVALLPPVSPGPGPGPGPAT